MATKKKWEAEVWQTENGKWRWSLFRDGELLAGSKKSCNTEGEAIAQAREKRSEIDAPPRSRRISLDDE